MNQDLIPVVAGAAWLTLSLIFGISRAVWCGYSGDESEPSELLFILGWPIIIAAIPFACAVWVASSPFYLAHWVGRVIAKRRAEGAGAGA